jgi:hypothetical protein
VQCHNKQAPSTLRCCTHGETQQEWMERPSCKSRRCWATSAQESRTSFNLKNKTKMKRRNKGIFLLGVRRGLACITHGWKTYT